MEETPQSDIIEMALMFLLDNDMSIEPTRQQAEAMLQQLTENGIDSFALDFFNEHSWTNPMPQLLAAARKHAKRLYPELY